jgi:hypothetical protein
MAQPFSLTRHNWAKLSRRAAIITPNHQCDGGGVIGLSDGCCHAFLFEIVLR